jgi:hypothetical protein
MLSQRSDQEGPGNHRVICFNCGRIACSGVSIGVAVANLLKYDNVTELHWKFT